MSYASWFSRAVAKSAQSLVEKPLDALHGIGKSGADDRGVFGEGGEQAGGDLTVQQHEDATVIGAANEAAESLAEAEADDGIVILLRYAVR